MSMRHNGPVSNDFDVNEMSLTGNMKLTEMMDRKIKWKTVDDKDGEVASKLDYGDDLKKVTLEPQRIRVFTVERKG